jgi:hypothetical protein
MPGFTTANAATEGVYILDQTSYPNIAFSNGRNSVVTYADFQGDSTSAYYNDVSNPSGYNIEGIGYTGSTNTWYQNYTPIVSSSTDSPTGGVYATLGLGVYNGNPDSVSMSVQWVRVRAYPPNGVMPSYSFGGATLSISPNPSTYPNGNIILSASCVPSTATCEVEFPVGTVVATGTGSASYTISNVLAAGSYTASANAVGYIGNQTKTIIILPGPSSLPSGILNYSGIIITYNKSVAYPNPFQQMINISESSYSNYLSYNGNFANFELFFSNGTIIPSWIESNSSGKLIVWAKLPSSFYSSSSTYNTIYIGFASKSTNLLSSSGTSGIGEAPQLSSTYAQYDDGASVFNFYDNFAGTSLNTSKWTSYGSPVITVNNGLTLNSASSWSGIYTASFNPQAYINDFDAYFTGLVGSSGGPEQTIGWEPGGTSTPQYFLSDADSTTEYDLVNNNGAGNTVYISGGSTTAYQIWSLWATSTASYLSLNYGTPVSNTGGFTASTSLHTGVGSLTSSYKIKVQWFRLRAYPPNGVMPSYSFGQVCASLGTPSIISPAATNTLDEGQSINIEASVTGGTPPYTYNYIISQYNVPSHIIAEFSVSNSLTTNSIVWTTNAIGTFVANVIVTEGSSATNSIYSANIVVNPAPTANALIPSNTMLDSGQYVTYSVSINGGTLPITANLVLVSNTMPLQINGANAVPGSTVNTIVLGAGSAEPNTITFNSLELTASSNGILTFNVIAVDSATTPVTFNAVASTITVNPALTVSISPTNNKLDVPQTLSLTTTVSGGTPNFGIAYSGNGLCGTLSATSNTLSSDGSNTIVFTPNSAITSNCLFTLTATVTDNATTHSTATATSTINVYPQPSVTLTPSNTVLDSGQTETYTITVYNGIGPFNVELYNITGSEVQVSNVIISSPGGSNTLAFTVNSPTSGNTFEYNAIVTDNGASTPYVFNSISNTITVDTAPYITLTVTPANSLMYGTPFTVNAVINGGTGNFAVYWFVNGNALPSNSVTVISANTQTSNTMVLAANGVYAYTVEANDIGTSSVYSTEAANTVLIYINNTLTASLAGNPGTTYYQQPVTITFNGVPTINNQSPWELFVNGALYGKTKSKITWSENDASVGTYSFLFENPGNNNYTSNSISTSLSIIYMPSGVSVITKTTTTTTTVPTTTIPPPAVTNGTAANISRIVSATSPLEIKFANEQATIRISTSSRAPTPIIVYLSNATSAAPKPPSNYTVLKALNLTVSANVSISVNISMAYPCSTPAPSVAPFIYKNGTWTQIPNYVVNTTECIVVFSVPSDPLVALLSNIHTATTATVTTSTTTSTIPTTTIAAPPPPAQRNNFSVILLTTALVIGVIIFVACRHSRICSKKVRKHH